MARRTPAEIRDNARLILQAKGLARAAEWIAKEYARQKRPGLGFDWKDGHPSTREAEILVGWGETETALTSLLCQTPSDAELPAIRRAQCQRQLEDLLRSRTREWNLGLGILPSGRACATCGTEHVRYSWAEYDSGKVPTLPRHEGCACSYMPYLTG